MTGRAGKTIFISAHGAVIDLCAFIKMVLFFWLSIFERRQKKDRKIRHSKKKMLGFLVSMKFANEIKRGIVVYKIKKVVNNNIVCAIDEKNEEVILRGLGIGFSKKANEYVPEELIEKVYRMDGAKSMNKLQELLEEIPTEYVAVCTDIIDHAKEVLNRRLNNNIYITLTDHISFAIARQKEKMEYKNAMLSEIKCFYPQEYQLGVEALSIIKERLGVQLSIDEAGFIALHIVNAELDTNMSSMVQITELIQKILEIVSDYYGMEFDEDSLHYSRFITHLKFFGQRLFKKKETKSDDIVFQEMIKKQYPNDYQCAELIRAHIEERYHRKITEEEMMFLTVHLRRISM